MRGHADIAVLALGDVESSTSRRAALEAILMESGRPILAIPTTWTMRNDMKRVLIAWDGGRKAARAIGDAEPFLDRADEVVVATIDAQPKARGVGPAPGPDIAPHLARRLFRGGSRNFGDLGEETGDGF